MNNKFDTIFYNLVEDFSNQENVEGIMLSGSRVIENFDNDSDYDLYIYFYEEIPLEFRTKIAEKFFKYSELDNRTWEQEDAGYFKETNIQADIVFRNIDWIKDSLRNVVKNFQASTGYTTCLWGNFLNSEILFDRSGILKEMFTEFDIDYPEDLQKEIIAKNYPLLNKNIPAYVSQIQKARKRDDLLSINHRLSAFFESYFDIIFALNKIPHPGEKRMMEIALEKCKIIPGNMENDINDIFRKPYNKKAGLIEKLNNLVEKLDVILFESQ